jgi:hypothetical protein
MPHKNPAVKKAYHLEYNRMRRADPAYRAKMLAERNRYPLICQHCGKNSTGKKGAKFCSRRCSAQAMHASGTANLMTTDGTGKYKAKWVKGRVIREHRLVMERHVGRSLTASEHVHHINGNRADNRVENLMILTNAQHALTHMSRPRGTR